MLHRASDPAVSMTWSKPHGSRASGWLRYFLAALSIGTASAQDTMLLRYWWIFEEPLPPVTDSTRVIRVFGEKGENYVELDDISTQSAGDVVARAERTRILREEAYEIARQLIAEGKPLDVAYEQAWATVYRRHWLHEDFLKGDSELERVLKLIAESEDVAQLKPEELRRTLAALLGDETRMNTAEGRAMVEHLSAHLHQMGFGARGMGVGANDELMTLFVDALRHDYNAFAAFRDALFKSRHDRVMHHDLEGYLAPWGAGLPGRVRYQQAPVKVGRTLATGTTLANKTAASGSTSKTDEQEEEKKKSSTTDESTGPKSAYMGPETTGEGNYRPMRFAMLRPMTLAAAEPAADLIVASKAALYFENGGETLSGNTSITRSGYNKNRYTYTTSNHGSYNDAATWTSISNDRGTGTAWYWQGSSGLGDFSRQGSIWNSTYAAEAEGGLSSSVSLIDLYDGAELYMGGADFAGTIRMVEKGDFPAYLGSYLPEGAMYNMGKLTGSGTLRLMAHGSSNQASIYSFSDAGADSSSWLSGTVQFGASQGGRVELDLGVEGNSTAWENVVFDLTPTAGPGHSTTTGSIASRTILNIRNDVTIAGLMGGTGNSTVTSESGDAFFDLTLGSDDAASDYVYSGTFNGAYYTSATGSQSSSASFDLIKVGANQQTFTGDVTRDENRLHSVSVRGGQLRFDGDGNYSDSAYTKSLSVRYASVSGTGELLAQNLTVYGQQLGSPALNISGGRVDVNDTITVSVNLSEAEDLNAGGEMTVSGGSVKARKLIVDNHLEVTGGQSSLNITESIAASSMAVAHGAKAATTNLNVPNWLEVGYGSYDANVGLDARPVLTTTGTLNAGELRLRGTGLLQTGSAGVQLGSAHMHGGGIWQLQGTGNVVSNSLSLEDTGSVGDSLVQLQGSSAGKGETVLTLPKVVSVGDTGWTNPDQALFELDGVTLDFREDIIISGVKFELSEKQVITLAEVGKNGGWFTDSYATDSNVASVRLSHGGYFWHGLLSGGGDKDIVITLQHKTEAPYLMNSGSLVYIQMHQNASAPALPYLAYEDGAWSDSSGWSGNQVEAGEMLKFGNVQISGGANLYLGEDLTVVEDADGNVVTDYRADRNYGGRITVAGDAAPAYLHGQIGEWGKWNLYGHLGGSGELVLVAHNGSASTTGDDNLASSFSFSSVTSPESWFSGTLYIDDPTGGIVQLEVGNVNIANEGDTRWKKTLIDLSHTGMTDAATGATDTEAASTHVLAVQGNTTLRGLHGEDTNAMVVSNQRATSTQPAFMLTLGEDSADATYTYKGIIGKGEYYQGGATATDEETGIQTNFYTTRTGSLSLTKIGSNTQEFSGEAYLDAVEVKAGNLVLSGTAELNSATVRAGATIQSNELSVKTITLEGGASWLTQKDEFNSYSTAVYINNVFGQDGSVNSITVGSATDSATGAALDWRPAQNMGMSGAGTWVEGSGAIFKLDDVHLYLDKPRVIAGLTGVGVGDTVALYSGVTGDYSSIIGKENLVMISNEKGEFFDAHYVFDADNKVISLKLDDEARNYGIVAREGYIWSGEVNGTTVPDDVHYINMTLGSVWKAGDAYNTGWHEQRAEGSALTDIGIYQNGNTVYFLDVNVHGVEEGLTAITEEVASGEYAAERRVDISGNVAPGLIYVNADHNIGKVDSGGDSELEYAYAFVSTDKTGCITDFDADTPTSMIKSGDGVLLLNLSNKFSGGIDVQDGGLYLAAVGAAGTGTLTFHTDLDWSQTVVGQDSTLSWEQSRHGAELMVCYAFDSNALSAFRGSSLGNDIVLTSSDDSQGGRFTVSFAYAGYNTTSSGDDHANLPRHWRNLILSGALVGTGDSRDVLALTGYSSTWVSGDDQSYVTVLTMNEDTAGPDAYKRDDASGKILNRFNGTVVLENTINTSPLNSNEIDGRTAGTVQVVLKGDKLMEAQMDLTRESTDYQGSWDNWNEGLRQTYNNILVLNGDARLRGLTAEFHGSGWDYQEWATISNSDHTAKEFEANLPQNDEVWHVRVLTSGENTLRLGTYGDTANTGTYVYSGAMGFAQAYAGTSQGHVPWGDGFFQHTNENWKYGGHEMGLEKLSLVKSSASAQYIHTALLNDVSLYEGTLGFNSLQLQGNMNLVGSTTLKLGVTGSVGNETDSEDKETWDKIDDSSGSVMAASKVDKAGYKKVNTSDTVTVNDSKTLTVITQDTVLKAGEEVPTTATVEGNIVMEANSTLTFRTNDILPYSLPVNTYDINGTVTGIVLTKDNEPKDNEAEDNEAEDNEKGIVPLLDIVGAGGGTGNGTLTINSLGSLSVNLTGANFSMDAFGSKKYYLAAADEIRIYGKTGEDDQGNPTYGYLDETEFGSRTISLGYGYFGTLYTVGNAGSSIGDGDIATRDYLIMSITGDPRRTWSGNITAIAGDADDTRDAHAWFNTTTLPPKAEYDYRWKENKAFMEGLVVLFGNLYEPVEWTKTSELLSDATVNVKGDVLHPGTTVLSVEGEYDFNIDRYSLETTYTDAQKTAAEEAGISLDYQAVRVDGVVAPFSIIINSEYYKYEKDADDEYTVLVLNEDGGSLHTDNTNYYFYTTGEVTYDDDGNVSSDTRGRIVDADPGILEEDLGFDPDWKTMLHKTGTGTTVMALDNSYSGGSILQGGRLVMQHENALGTGTITLLNGALLQGDFKDINISDEGNNYLGKAMDTTTIHNPVVVNVYADPADPSYDTLIDGRIANSYDKKLVLTSLAGESDTVLQLNGVGLSAAKSTELYGVDDKYRYGVFKVLDPSRFQGTVRMIGHEWGAEGTDVAVAGRVQLDIMSTTKSADGADWTNATVDLTVNEGTERTVLALDATGEVDPDTCEVDPDTGEVDLDTGYEWCVLNSITGSINTDTGTTSVLNISAHNAITLVLTGSRNGLYHGVMGYGDFQVAVNYGGYAESEQGTEKHHYGAKGMGELNLIKQGAGTIQTVRRGWLHDVVVEGGDFHAEEALVANSLVAGGGKRIIVGNTDKSSLYALTVGAGGVLAMNTEVPVSGTKTDAFAGISAGTTEGDSTKKAGWVLLENGATLSAREDWYTCKTIDIAEGASVTVNTHNFTIDPYILTDECKDAAFLEKRETSHLIQLLGKVSGRNVNITFNNWKTDPTDKQNPDAELREQAVRDIGYVALSDLNDFTGSSKVTVEDMTVLQILTNNGGVKADVDITVAGKNATLQIVDQAVSYNNSDSPSRSNTMVQYIDELKLGAYDASLNDGVEADPYKQQNNGQLLLGGMEQTTMMEKGVRLTTPDLAGMQVTVSSRHTGQPLEGQVKNLNVDMRGTAVRMGGDSARQAEFINTHVDMENMQVAHTVHHADILNSLVHLQNRASVNIADVVLVDAASSVHGFNVDESVLTPDDPCIRRDANGSYVAGGPDRAAAAGDNTHLNEVTTSVATTVHMTFASFEGNDPNNNVYQAGNSKILVLLTDQFQGVDVSGNGLTIQLQVDNWVSLSRQTGADYIAIQMGGGSGQFHYEVDNNTATSSFGKMLDSQFVLRDSQGNQMTGMWVTSTEVSGDTGQEVSPHMLYFQVVPEPATATLGLLALTALLARRRRR